MFFLRLVILALCALYTPSAVPAARRSSSAPTVGGGIDVWGALFGRRRTTPLPEAPVSSAPGRRPSASTTSTTSSARSGHGPARQAPTPGEADPADPTITPGAALRSPDEVPHPVAPTAEVPRRTVRALSHASTGSLGSLPREEAAPAAGAPAQPAARSNSAPTVPAQVLQRHPSYSRRFGGGRPLPSAHIRPSGAAPLPASRAVGPAPAPVAASSDEHVSAESAPAPAPVAQVRPAAVTPPPVARPARPDMTRVTELPEEEFSDADTTGNDNTASTAVVSPDRAPARNLASTHSAFRSPVPVQRVLSTPPSHSAFTDDDTNGTHVRAPGEEAPVRNILGSLTPTETPAARRPSASAVRGDVSPIPLAASGAHGFMATPAHAPAPAPGADAPAMPALSLPAAHAGEPVAAAQAPEEKGAPAPAPAATTRPMLTRRVKQEKSSGVATAPALVAPQKMAAPLGAAPLPSVGTAQAKPGRKERRHSSPCVSVEQHAPGIRARSSSVDEKATPTKGKQAEAEGSKTPGGKQAEPEASAPAPAPAPAPADDIAKKGTEALTAYNLNNAKFAVVATLALSSGLASGTWIKGRYDAYCEQQSKSLLVKESFMYFLVRDFVRLKLRTRADYYKLTAFVAAAAAVGVYCIPLSAD